MVLTPTTVADELRRIVESFKLKSSFKPKELELMNVKSLDELNSVAIAIQADQRKSRQQQYLQRLEPFVNAMLQFGKVIEVFLNASEILCFVWVFTHTLRGNGS